MDTADQTQPFNINNNIIKTNISKIVWCLNKLSTYSRPYIKVGADGTGKYKRCRVPRLDTALCPPPEACDTSISVCRSHSTPNSYITFLLYTGSCCTRRIRSHRSSIGDFISAPARHTVIITLLSESDTLRFRLYALFLATTFRSFI